MERSANPGLTVDAHTHIFCWGENPAEGFLSRRTQTAWTSRLLLAVTGIQREHGQTISAKMRNRLLRQVRASGSRHQDELGASLTQAERIELTKLLRRLAAEQGITEHDFPGIPPQSH